MSRNYQDYPALYDYLTPYMSPADRRTHEEMCGRGQDDAEKPEAKETDGGSGSK